MKRKNYTLKSLKIEARWSQKSVRTGSALCPAPRLRFGFQGGHPLFPVAGVVRESASQVAQTIDDELANSGILTRKDRDPSVGPHFRSTRKPRQGPRRRGALGFRRKTLRPRCPTRLPFEPPKYLSIQFLVRSKSVVAKRSEALNRITPTLSTGKLQKANGSDHRN